MVETDPVGAGLLWGELRDALASADRAAPDSEVALTRVDRAILGLAPALLTADWRVSAHQGGGRTHVSLVPERHARDGTPGQDRGPPPMQYLFGDEVTVFHGGSTGGRRGAAAVLDAGRRPVTVPDLAWALQPIPSLDALSDPLVDPAADTWSGQHTARHVHRNGRVLEIRFDPQTGLYPVAAQLLASDGSVLVEVVVAYSAPIDRRRVPIASVSITRGGAMHSLRIVRTHATEADRSAPRLQLGGSASLVDRRSGTPVHHAVDAYDHWPTFLRSLVRPPGGEAASDAVPSSPDRPLVSRGAWMALVAGMLLALVWLLSRTKRKSPIDHDPPAR